jgi:hypothetical protein
MLHVVWEFGYPSTQALNNIFLVNVLWTIVPSSTYKFVSIVLFSNGPQVQQCILELIINSSVRRTMRVHLITGLRSICVLASSKDIFSYVGLFSLTNYCTIRGKCIHELLQFYLTVCVRYTFCALRPLLNITEQICRQGGALIIRGVDCEFISFNQISEATQRKTVPIF